MQDVRFDNLPTFLVLVLPGEQSVLFCCFLLGDERFFFKHIFFQQGNHDGFFDGKRHYDSFCLKLAAFDVGWILKKELLHLTGVKGW